MRFPVIVGLLLSAVTLLASKKVVSPATSASNDQVDIVATISLTEDEVTQKAGAIISLDFDRLLAHARTLGFTPEYRHVARG